MEKEIASRPAFVKPDKRPGRIPSNGREVAK